MREKIYRIVHIYDGNKYSKIYKWFMIVVICISFIPLVTKQTNLPLRIIDVSCLVIYISDYLLRWVSVDYKYDKHYWTSFVKFPFRFISIVDMMSIVALFCSVFGWFGNSAFVKALMVFRIIRIFKYFKITKTILEIFRKSKKALYAVGTLAIGYIFVSALIIFNVEPETFKNFFEAVYWATVSLTTVGYGDIYPVTAVGRTIAMMSSFFGIAIVALPAGVVTAEYLNSVKEDKDDK